VRAKAVTDFLQEAEESEQKPPKVTAGLGGSAMHHTQPAAVHVEQEASEAANWGHTITGDEQLVVAVVPVPQV